MITATELELRAGARILLEPTTLRVQPGDRIGLVGRNGAGQDHQPAGARRGDAAARRADRRDAARSATCRRIRAPAIWTSPRATGCCPPAAWTRWSPTSPRSRSQLAETPGRRRPGAPVRQPRGALRRAGRVRGRERGRPHLRQPRPAGPRARPDAGHAVRRPAPPGRARADPVRRLRRRAHDPAARRADQPPRRRLDRLAARLPAPAHRRPGPDQPRRRPARRRREQGLVPRREPCGASTSTTSAGRPTCSSARPTNDAGTASGPTPNARSRRCAARPTRCGPRRPRPGPRTRWTGAPPRWRPDLAEVRVDGQGGPAAVPGAGPVRAHPADRRRACRSPTARSRCSPTSTWRSTAGRGSSCSGSTAPARRRCCACWPASSRPTPARCVPGHGLRLGYYAQEHETLDHDRSVLDNMRTSASSVGRSDLTDTELRKILGAFLFSGDDVDKPAGVLSGGEKTRLALAMLVTERGQRAAAGRADQQPRPGQPRAGARRAAHLRRRDRARDPRRGRRRGARPRRR